MIHKEKHTLTMKANKAIKLLTIFLKNYKWKKEIT